MDQTLHTLTISSTNPSDTGVYKAVVTNVAGEVTSEAKVTVTGKIELLIHVVMLFSICSYICYHFNNSPMFINFYIEFSEVELHRTIPISILLYIKKVFKLSLTSNVILLVFNKLANTIFGCNSK